MSPRTDPAEHPFRDLAATPPPDRAGRLVIERADFTDRALHAFLRAHLADMAPTAPPESRHALDLSKLQQPGVRLWVGREDGVLVTTGALATLDAPHEVPHQAPRDEEVKSMRTAPDRRGRGIARRMLDHLLDDARSRQVPRVWLETGSMEFFAPARALYRSAGFIECGPFGSYVTDPHSTFMTLLL